MGVVISAVLQAVLFLVLPFVWWTVTARRRIGFFAWLGWKRPVVTRPTVLVAVMVGAFLLFLVPAFVIAPRVASSAATSQFHGLGWAGLPEVIAYALLQTAFAEESLFRGFLLKRVAVSLGFWPANAIQAVVFALVHAVPFGLVVNAGWGLAIGVLTGAIGALLGYLNERLAGGSLIPGWMLHAGANLLTGCLALAAVL
ncbi:CPBP family intramembrane glutamic endopeptidase [Raineyella sp.]|uniref:CAAX prenyl protease 2/Lysostaphin resistance protein A-like domain-containing protein n=1 Tax=bioreactor metagenome TaxID=1076179 RepID=A0A645AIC5_9ZZZZ|nr:CPBP family intramembrane glutamic endopeptidase [Raineyella sp.]MEA5155329.1 CPBP family intramembrane glutamic endopeptidase [Raineyella sp.]